MAHKLEDNTEIRDNVFKIIGEHPVYRVKLCEDLLSCTDLVPDDVEVVSFSKEKGYGMENDVGLLCKGRTIVLIEASTRTPYNMPVRMLMYAAVTYRDYISEHEIDIRSDAHLKLPGLEAYVVYPAHSKKHSDFMYFHDYVFDSTSLDLAVKVLDKGAEGSPVIKDYIEVCDIVTEGRSKGYTGYSIGEWVRQRCLERGLFVDIMSDPKYNMAKELESMYTVKELKEIGRVEGREEGLEEGREEGLEEGLERGVERAVYVLSKQLGVSLDEARKVYEQTIVGFSEFNSSEGA